MPESGRLQQGAAAAASSAEELAGLAGLLRALEEGLKQEQEVSNSLTTEVQGVQQQVSELDKAICGQCLHAAEYLHIPSTDSRHSSTSDGGGSSSRSLSSSSSRSASISSSSVSLSVRSSTDDAPSASGSWFTKSTGLCDQAEVELLQQEIAALNLQLADSEYEASKMQADVLSRTDNRIVAETDMRDNMESGLDTLQCCLQDAKDDVEGQLNEITELRFELVTTKRTSANRRENVQQLLRLLLQQVAGASKIRIHL